MKYDLRSRKFRDFWLRAYLNGYQIENEKIKAEIIKDNFSQSKHGFNKNVFDFSSDWEEVAHFVDLYRGTASNFYYKRWKVELNPFPESFIPFIYYAVLYRRLENISFKVTRKIDSIFQVNDLYDESGNVIDNIKKVVLITHVRLERELTTSINTMEAKLIVKIVNPNSYV